MEINITWNVCRVCLQEHNAATNTNMEKHTFQINLDMAKEILEMTGVVIKPNDSLPQKICRKCSQVLKQSVHFRTTCRSSDTYLQNILEKAKSTTSLFKLDKPNKIVFEDIAEEPTEDFFSEEQQWEDCSNEPKRKRVEHLEDAKKNHKKLEEQLATFPSDIDKKLMKTDLENDETSEMITSDLDLLSKSQEREFNKSNVDFGSMFLNSESDVEQQIDSRETIKNTSFSETEQKDDNTIKKHVESNSFLQYKTLEVELDSSEEDAQGEMLQTNKLSSIDITNNDGIHELFFIFSDNVMEKNKENNVPNHTKEDTILVENIAEIDDNIDENLGEEEDFDELVCSESNTLDRIDCIDEEQSKYDIEEDFIKCEGISRETTPNNENGNFYQQDDSIDRTIVQYKPFQIEENITEFDKNEEDTYVIKTDQPKSANNFCQICGNQFSSRSLLKHHMRVHRNERNYECEMCFKRFTAACNLTTHMRTHTGEKPFVCHFCHRRFSDKSTHVKHERSHTGERPYSCTICHKAFTLSSSLKAHEKVHSGEKPFNCYTCGKSFKLPHQLKAHLSTNAHKIRLEEEVIIPTE